MEQTIKERLILFLKAKKMSHKKFETEAGLSNGYLANLVSTPSASKLTSILSAFPELNRNWLLTGEGEMLIENTQPKLDENSSPCFDLATIQGGAGHGTGMEQLNPGMEIGRMLVPGLKTGSDIPYIQVMGNSMVNRQDPSRSIPEGSWVGVKASTLSTVMWGEVYAIMTTDGPIIKKLMPSDKEGYVKCVSFNEEDGYLPFDLLCTDIIPPLYNIIGVVSVKRWK